MQRLRAWLRVISVVGVLAYFLSRLLATAAVRGHTDDRAFRYRRKFIRTSLGVLGVEVFYRGVQIDEPALYVSNHRSLLDPFLNLLKIDAWVVSKAEVSSYPLVGKGARETGVIFVDRENSKSRAVAKEAIRNALMEGKSILIYPEGTTSNFDTTRDFRLGSFKVAAELGIPVVPVALDYRKVEHKWHDGRLLPFFIRKFGDRRIDAAMAIGEPIKSDDATLLMRESTDWIHRQLQFFKTRWAED